MIQEILLEKSRQSGEDIDESNQASLTAKPAYFGTVHTLTDRV